MPDQQGLSLKAYNQLACKYSGQIVCGWPCKQSMKTLVIVNMFVYGIWEW
jgi:hypothetical protein